MYQRYIANPDGTFQKSVVEEPEPQEMQRPERRTVEAAQDSERGWSAPGAEWRQNEAERGQSEMVQSEQGACASSRPCEPEQGRAPRPQLSLRKLLPETLDVGDLLLALILLLVFLDGEEGDAKTVLLMLAVCFLH